jgi:hypothetical protein
LYTQAWDTSKATNSGQSRGQDHYTIANSVIATNATDSGDVSCPQDVSYLSANGQDFCTAYISYIPPVVTSTVTQTPATSVITSVDTLYTTQTSYTTYQSIDVTYTTTTSTVFQKRDLATPASAVSWSPSRLSKACVASTPLSTFLTTTSATTSLLIETTATTLSISTVVSVFKPTATSLGLNLVVNGDFEEDLKGNWAGPTDRCNNGAYRIGNQAYATYEGTAYG